MLFQEEINNIDTWAKVFQSIDSFKPMIQYLFDKHELPYSPIEHCIPGSNAVFKVGAYIVKIFAPMEAQVGHDMDYFTEKYGITRALRMNLTAPNLVAFGELFDKYIFRYFVLEYIDGTALSACHTLLSSEQKRWIGQQLRGFTDRLDRPCRRFNAHDLFNSPAEMRWKNFSTQFQTERKAYISTLSIENLVYVHGDLNRDNILIKSDGGICVIDYADGLQAPIEFEYAVLICDAFQFDSSYLQGFFGDFNKDNLIELCLRGLLIHDFGYNLILDCFGDVNEISSIPYLRELISSKL